jgi:excisionase family DNA binding protein
MARLPKLNPRELLVTVEEASTLLRCSRVVIFQLISKGKIQPGPKTGRRRTVTRVSVETFALSEPFRGPRGRQPRNRHAAWRPLTVKDIQI